MRLAAKNAMICLFCAALIGVLSYTSAHAGPMLYVHDEYGTLATVNASTGKVSMIGSMGVVMTDIASDRDGNLFGISYNDLYQIDRRTAAVTRVGRHDIPGANALLFSPEGSLHAAGAGSTKLFSINADTGSATAIREIGFASAGDLAYAPEGPVIDSAGNHIQYICGNPDLIYMSSTGGNLVSIGNRYSPYYFLRGVAEFEGDVPTAVDVRNPLDYLVPGIRPYPIADWIPVSNVVGNLGVTNMYGLASGPNGELYGLAGNAVYAINKQTGSASVLSSFAGQGLGQVFGASCVTVPEPGSVVLAAFAGVATIAVISRPRRRSNDMLHDGRIER
jgi:hypothetical protein